MSTVRLRRLQADYDKLTHYIRHHPRLQLIQAEGTPPERYQIEFQILSLRQKTDELVEVRGHLVELALPLNYPRMPPHCRMLTPVFHPNIAPHAICIGDHWSPGEPLASIVQRIGEMLAYQSYNTKSPLNGEAARWVNDNLDRLPLDPVSMIVDEPPPQAAAPRPAPRPAVVPQPMMPLPEAPPANPAPACTSCGSQLRANPALVGKKIRCPKCQTVQTYPDIGIQWR